MKANIRVILASAAAAVVVTAAGWLIVGKTSPVASLEGAGCAEKPRQLKNLQGSRRPTGEVGLIDGSGATIRLQDFRGRPLVVNFWATWCAPCVAEMPELDRLRAMAGGSLAVIAVSEDRPMSTATGSPGEPVADLIRRFYAANKIEGLPVIVDPEGKMARAYGVEGLPTTLLIDSMGRERARLVGTAEWGSDEVRRFLETCLKG